MSEELLYVRNLTEAFNHQFEYFKKLAEDDPNQAVLEMEKFLFNRNLPLPSFYDASMHGMLAAAHYDLDRYIEAMGELNIARYIYSRVREKDVEDAAQEAWKSLGATLDCLFEDISPMYEWIREQLKRAGNAQPPQASEVRETRVSEGESCWSSEGKEHD